MKTKFIYRKSDSVFLQGGYYDVQLPLIPGPVVDGQPTFVPDVTNYGVAEFGDADQPDLRLHRYDATLGKRLTTPLELSATDDARVAEIAQLTSRQKDVLATIAYIIRRSDVAAWNAMTMVQRRNAVFTQADIWRDLRVIADKL